jgi:hypothetical protein
LGLFHVGSVVRQRVLVEHDHGAIAEVRKEAQDGGHSIQITPPNKKVILVAQGLEVFAKEACVFVIPSTEEKCEIWKGCK